MSIARGALKHIYPLIPDRIRYRFDTYRKIQKIRDLIKELNHGPRPGVSPYLKEIGLNIFGFLSAGFGLGEAARSTIRGAEAVGLPISLYDIELPTHPVDRTISLKTSDQRKLAVNLFHFNPDVIETLINEPIKSRYLSAGYNIGFWFWETTQLPDHWALAADLFDEIWVGSTFCASAVRSKVSKPVIKIPLNVTPHEAGSSCGRTELGLPEQGFLFLTMMDFFSRPERKNPFAAIQAFEKAFGSGSTDAYLIVKVTNSEISREIERLKDLSRNNKSIIILDRFLARSELQSLISNIDCLFSLHRAEGFGLPIAEAMSFGKPVIATGWSANMDFMTSENSFPVSYDMTTLDSYAPPYPRGTVWAKPKIDEAANIMRKLVNNPELCREVGDKARADINSRFSAAVTGQRIVERLKQIQGKM